AGPAQKPARPRHRRRAGRTAERGGVRRQPPGAARILHRPDAAAGARCRRAAPAGVPRLTGAELAPPGYFLPAMPAPIPGANGAGAGPPFFFLFLSCFGFFFSFGGRICPLAMIVFSCPWRTALYRPELIK